MRRGQAAAGTSAPGARDFRPRAVRLLSAALGALLAAATACTPFTAGQPTQAPATLDAAVAGTLTALAPDEPTAAATNTTAASDPAPTPTAGPSTATPAPAPAGSLSLNCDGTYQRVRLEAGASGRTLYVDQWTGDSWSQSWSYNAGDPQLQQVAPEAGAYAFGGCERLIVVPVDYMGSGSVLELRVFRWDPDGPIEVYANNGIGGDWQREGERLTFDEALYLYSEPNCCPCNRLITVDRWNGTAFIEADHEVQPTYTGTPPPICSP